MKNLPCQERKTYTDMIEDIVTQIVDKPDDVDVIEIEDANWLHVKIWVNDEDKGKLIGKKGSIIGAIHTLMVAISRGEKVAVDVAKE